MIELLKKNPYFEKLDLKKNEIIFNEGEIDENIYIIISGFLYVEKYIDKEGKNLKLLSILKNGDIFGEGAIDKKEKKQVRITCRDKAQILKISSKNFLKFIQDYRELSIQFLKEIISISNSRLLESNFLITFTYNISKNISELKELNYSNLFKIIDNLVQNLEQDFILYIEKNPFVENIYNIKYNSKNIGKMQEFIFKSKSIEDVEKVLLEKKLLKKNFFIQSLRITDKDFGFLVFSSEKKQLNETQKKAISSVILAIAFILKQIFS